VKEKECERECVCGQVWVCEYRTCARGPDVCHRLGYVCVRERGCVCETKRERVCVGKG